MNETLMKVKSKCIPVLTSAIVLVGSATSCFAAEESVATSVGTALEPVKADSIAVLGTVAPYGIAIMGAFLVWKYGIRFFKGLAK